MSTPPSFVRLAESPASLEPLRRYARELFELPRDDTPPDEAELELWGALEVHSLNLVFSVWKEFRTTLPGHPYMLPDVEVRVGEWLGTVQTDGNGPTGGGSLHVALQDAAAVAGTLLAGFQNYERPKKTSLLSRLTNRSERRFLPDLHSVTNGTPTSYFDDWPFEPVHAKYQRASSLMGAFLNALPKSDRVTHARHLRPVALMTRVWRLHPAADVVETTGGLHHHLPELFRLGYAGDFVPKTLGVEKPLSEAEAESTSAFIERLDAERTARFDEFEERLKKFREGGG